MKLYTRKSIRVGAFRFTVSKSGVNVSAGVKGFRVGSGPRGNYVSISKNGLRYRYTIPKTNTPKDTKFTPSENPRINVFDRSSIDLTHGPRIEIESGSISDIVDSNSAELVEEITSKKNKKEWTKAIFVAGAILNAFAFYKHFPFMSVPIVFCILATIAARYRDIVSKTTVIMYNIDGEFSIDCENMLDTFKDIMLASKCWHIESKSDVYNAKCHAGASGLLERSLTSLSFSDPPSVKTNILVPSIPVGLQTLYFFPDRVLVFEHDGVGAVSYENLDIRLATQRFIEEDTLPHDAEIVGSTWRYVNKRGGPDLRFRDNYEIPIVLYDYMYFTSSTGLNECICVSNTGVLYSFKKALKSFSSRASI